ncbi:MAG: ATP-binding protein [Oligoflexia bacterium]|nr:ATP-binding protein [Oligoflexia bacterium]
MFLGRENELKSLNKCLKQKKSLFLVCSGRRRIGKSTLIEEFAKTINCFYEFQGLHPLEGKNEEDQLDHFSNRMKIYFKRPKMKFSSWLEAFHELSEQIGKKTSIIFFDEISWMSTGSKTFSAQLKDAWDTLF